MYQPGDTIQWGEHAPGFRKGEKVTVLRREGEQVRVAKADGEVKVLPLALAERFELYRTDRLAVADGEKLRITRNGYVTTPDGKQHRLNNGELVTVRFTPKDDLTDERGWITLASFGHLAHGVVTSHASQGDEADYTQFLHRAADSAGLSFWVNSLKQGATLEQVEAGLVGSTEYFQNRGGGTNSGFLTALYQDTLNRTVDSSGQAFFSQQLTSGTTTAQVAAEIFASTEFRQDVVQGFYQRLLHRTADSAGLSFFVGALQQGQQEKDVAATILASTEFFQLL
jgi:hypothetical protein